MSQSKTKEILKLVGIILAFCILVWLIIESILRKESFFAAFLALLLGFGIGFMVRDMQDN